MTKSPHTLNFTVTQRFVVQCESRHHAESVAQSLQRWSEQELHRIEPIERTIECSSVIFPFGSPTPEVGASESRVNP